MTLLVVIVFVAVYAGMALGRWPGLGLDRTGIALIGGMGLGLAGAVTPAAALEAIDFPTLFVLFGLMILSARFAESGFYDWCVARIAAARAGPVALLALTVAVTGLLSAVLSNDVVVFAMTPLLCLGLGARGLDPRPFLIALAGAANAGSAATMIGNPQNILIGQTGRLDFFDFLLACGPPAVLSLVVVHVTVLLVWRGRWSAPVQGGLPTPRVDRLELAWAGLATLALLALFASPLPQAESVLIIGGLMLLSRNLATRAILGLVDWSLLVLFAGLFVVTAAFSQTGLPAAGLAWLAGHGLPVADPAVLTTLALAGSNTVGNVPAVMLFLKIVPDAGPGLLYSLALLSTLAGNLLLVGSLANIIVAERAAAVGVRLTFRTHAACGVPMTIASMALALLWLTGLGYLPWK
ncbi:YbiR family transporter [Stella humosa]|uniref:YbiR family transporter n=1 Tax=Stella humosa TaxID=94 RepID=A0A3N1LHM7_9PROT|nr:SLC13 family permease [Stella humosa]ROP91037.1 YbiR family transporter [Stella humosa]BBK34613.1 transporter [Stella humosa]